MDIQCECRYSGGSLGPETCLEGQGVTPDVIQDIDSNQLSTGTDQQVSAALNLAGSL